MNEAAMQAHVQVINGKAVVKLHGRFDFSAHREFRGSCNACLDNIEVKEINVDMGGVEYLDSSALGMLLMLKERADAVAKRVILSECRDTVRQVLAIANFGKIFSIV